MQVIDIFEEEVIFPENSLKVKNRKKYLRNRKSKEKELEKEVLQGNCYKVLKHFSKNKYKEYFKYYNPEYICSKEVECLVFGDVYLDVFENGVIKNKKMTGKPLDREGLKLLKEFVPLENLKIIKISEDDFVVYLNRFEKRLYFLDEDKKEMFYLVLDDDQNIFSPKDEIYKWDNYYKEKFKEYFGKDFEDYTKRYYREYVDLQITNERKYNKYNNLRKRSKWFKKKETITKYRIKEKEIMNKAKKINIDSDAFDFMLVNLPEKDNAENRYWGDFLENLISFLYIVAFCVAIVAIMAIILNKS